MAVLKKGTYASVLDAAGIIWIASDFTEEHEKALDWLNDHTSNSIFFYGYLLNYGQLLEKVIVLVLGLYLLFIAVLMWAFFKKEEY